MAGRLLSPCNSFKAELDSQKKLQRYYKEKEQQQQKITASKHIRKESKEPGKMCYKIVFSLNLWACIFLYIQSYISVVLMHQQCVKKVSRVHNILVGALTFRNCVVSTVFRMEYNM